ncbi:hypothetical protein MZO42_03030 [Sphingomonas psychrotolerans]|uniref:Uncharacterized protein n=1 Tax=Sphingomonas psychrotolerans TaxID=1327635 RepID=A0ABU3MZE3_9SPHN|nr:hypothetical protein [Sphingomonas psychrotolerans]MDT8757662.1 hypothetical protein [Sphingomonas psychrotolerans]
MKVLFYLPMVTSWWFDHVVEPLIRTLAGQCEIYVLAPAPWCGTGIGARELQQCMDLPQIHWCIMEGPDHPSTRTLPESRDDITAWVRDLAPDYVLCRTADYETVQAFPGTVKLLMEGRLEPFAPPPHWIVFEDRPLDQGMLPELSGAERDALVKLIGPAWERLQERHAKRPGQRESVVGRCGIPDDRPTLLVPLEAETEDNFFRMHSVRARPNPRLVAELAERAGPDFTLVVTNHPINDVHVDAGPLLATVADLENVVLAPPVLGGEPATLALAKHVDGMILGDSKTFALGAFFGTPMLRQTRFESGAWLRSYSDLDRFLSAVAGREAQAPSEEDARLWFAFYMANNVFDPRAADINPEQILTHMERPVDSGRWEAGIARLRLALPALFA